MALKTVSNLTPGLPAAGREVKIANLTRLFEDTDTSYKFLWFLAILDEFKDSKPPNADAFHRIRFAVLVKRMLERAHLYTHHYKLRLGHRDKLDKHLENVVKASGGNINKRTGNLDLNTYRNFWKKIKLNEEATAFRQMIEYVPRRLLVPFLPQSIKNLNRKDKRQIIDAEFGQGWKKMRQPPLYFYSYPRREVEVPEEWCRYLSEHHTILHNWVLWNLASYLSVRNPSVPGINTKLMPPNRGPLTNLKLLWGRAWARQPGGLLCPYTRIPLLPKQYALDHFIPHSFIHHDLSWNLVPTTKAANSAKSDRLPPLDKYLGNFLDMQETAIHILAEQPGKLKEITVSYEQDVFEGEKLASVLANRTRMQKKLRQIIERNHEAASSQGFPLWQQQPSELVLAG